MPALIADQLASTGATINILVPIIGGALLLLGIAAIVIARLRRRRPE
jgi:LPXTG-motif cell wall-anchored protein